MSDSPTVADLRTALTAAGTAHHDYESRFLNGERDEQWPGWYAAYVLGRLGDFATPTDLATWLEEVPSEGVWADTAAIMVLNRLG